MTIKTWHAVAAAVLATTGALAAFGFKTPGANAAATEKRVDALEAEQKKDVEKNAAQDVAIEGMKRDIEYTARGVEALLLKEGLAPAPPRRRRGP